MESLSQKQRRFARYLARLIDRINLAGYEVTLGESFRSDEQACINAMGEAGRAALAALSVDKFPSFAKAVSNNGKNNGVINSVHQLKLAQDLNLFKGEVYLGDTESHRQFGEWWETLAPDCRWGGRFKDGNHYSIEHGGVK